MSNPLGNPIYSEEDLLPVSALADLVFCERRAALHFMEGIWENNLFTIEGTYLHQKVDAMDPTEVRGDLRIARGLRLRSLRLGLSGIADVVEFQRVPEDKLGITFEETTGAWHPMPVEYKRGRLRKEGGYEVQLCAQALCLEEMLNAEIPVGAIFYGKTKRRLEIAFGEKLRQETEKAAERLHELLESDSTPQPVRGSKCERCSLINLCLPRITDKGQSVRRYLSKAIAEAEDNTL